MKITFHGSWRGVSLIWVGFFQQSIGILWLLYQVLNVIQWFLGLNNWNGPSLPCRLGHVPKTSICTQTGVKSRKIQFLSIFQVWHLQTTYFCHHYQFLWLSTTLNNFFFENEKKVRFFENFLDFSDNGCCCDKMALKCQRDITNDCF